MAKHASILWTRLRRVLAAAPGRFPGGSAWIEPMSLLAVAREQLAARQRSQQETSPPAAGDEHRGDAAQAGAGRRHGARAGSSLAQLARTARDSSSAARTPAPGRRRPQTRAWARVFTGARTRSATSRARR